MDSVCARELPWAEVEAMSGDAAGSPRDGDPAELPAESAGVSCEVRKRLRGAETTERAQGETGWPCHVTCVASGPVAFG